MMLVGVVFEDDTVLIYSEIGKERGGVKDKDKVKKEREEPKTKSKIFVAALWEVVVLT